MLLNVIDDFNLLVADMIKAGFDVKFWTSKFDGNIGFTISSTVCDRKIDVCQYMAITRFDETIPVGLSVQYIENGKDDYKSTAYYMELSEELSKFLRGE